MSLATMPPHLSKRGRWVTPRGTYVGTEPQPGRVHGLPGALPKYLPTGPKMGTVATRWAEENPVNGSGDAPRFSAHVPLLW